jgi:putative peptidoglycan lipid II flippase
VSTIANLLLVGLIGLAALAFLFAPMLVAVLVPGFTADQQARTTELTRIMLASPILLALGSVASSALNGVGRFAAAAVAPIVYNLAIIGAAVWLVPVMGLDGLAFGVVAGSLGHVLVQLPFVRRAGFRFHLRIDLGDEWTRRALSLMGPRAVGLGVTQLAVVVLTAFASGLGPGAISAYSIAFAVFQIPIAVISVPAGIVILPALAERRASGATAAFVALLRRTVRLLLFFLLPITALGMVLREPIMTLLFGYGRIDAAALQATSGTLLVLLIGAPAYGLIGILARAFYAGHDTRTPVLAALLSAAFNVAVPALTIGQLGLASLAWSVVLGAWAEAVLLYVALGRSVPGMNARPDVGAWARFGVASLASAAGGWVVLAAAGAWALGGPPLALALLLAVTTAVGGAIYVLTMVALGRSEPAEVVRALAGALRHPAAP